MKFFRFLALAAFSALNVLAKADVEETESVFILTQVRDVDEVTKSISC